MLGNIDGVLTEIQCRVDPHPRPLPARGRGSRSGVDRATELAPEGSALLLLAGPGEVNSLFRSFNPSGQPRPFAGEGVPRAVGVAVTRTHLGGGRGGLLLWPCCGRGTFGASLFSEACSCCCCLAAKAAAMRAAPLALQIDGILLVDTLLLFRRRVRTRDVEAAILHEVVIGVAAARLAAAGELGVAFGKRRCLALPWLRISRRLQRSPRNRPAHGSTIARQRATGRAEPMQQSRRRATPRHAMQSQPIVPARLASRLAPIVAILRRLASHNAAISGRYRVEPGCSESAGARRGSRADSKDGDCRKDLFTGSGHG